MPLLKALLAVLSLAAATPLPQYEMQAAAESEGWSIDCRQLQAGKLVVGSVSGECATISLLDVFRQSPQECAQLTNGLDQTGEQWHA
jgi:hypothetical protein